MRYDIIKLLRENAYPGRGLILGCFGDGTRVIALYFIMGRSQNSRNRIFLKTDDGIRTVAFDPSKMTDPTLIIYNPVRVFDGSTIITNGDHTDTIHEFLSRGKNFRDALLTREYEPDAPNFTPRISGFVQPDGSYALSILKTTGSSSASCLRAFFEYSEPTPGLGHFISTYKSEGDPLPSFEGEPVPIDLTFAQSLEEYSKLVWEALNNDNKVSLYARETIIKTGESRDVIINKNS